GAVPCGAPALQRESRTEGSRTRWMRRDEGGRGNLLERLTALFGASLGRESLQRRFGRVIHEPHHLRHGVVTCPLGNESMHLLGDDAVRGMTLRGRTELDQMHRFARVE